MERREFLKRTGRAMVLAAASGGIGVLFHNRNAAGYRPLAVFDRRFTVFGDPACPAVAFARHPDPQHALDAALAAVGGIGRFVKPGETVTLKPNVGWDRTPEQAANTSPALVAAMVRRCLGAGAAAVVVTDMSCNDPRRCFLRSGVRDAAAQAGARVTIPAAGDFVEVDLDGELLTAWPVLRALLHTDRLINMPIVKHHSLTACTIGLKNLYGILGGMRHRLHQQIDQSLVDLTRFCTPTLTVIDATRVLLRNGPQGGSTDDVAVENAVLCATDPVAGDARGCELLGLTADRVPHLLRAEAAGLGRIDYRNAGYRDVTA